VRRKKPGPALPFEEKCSTLKVPIQLPEDHGQRGVGRAEAGEHSRYTTWRRC
jgi:hypothetical protein